MKISAVVGAMLMLIGWALIGIAVLGATSCGTRGLERELAADMRTDLAVVPAPRAPVNERAAAMIAAARRGLAITNETSVVESGPDSASPTPHSTLPTPTMPHQNTALIDAARTCSWAGRLFALVSVLAFLASFVPGVGPFVPRQGAMMAAGVGLGCFFVQYWVLAYGQLVAQASFWIIAVTCLVAGVATAVPFIIAAKRWALAKASMRLGQSGDPRASVALLTAAMPERLGGEDNKEKRKHMVAELEFRDEQKAAGIEVSVPGDSTLGVPPDRRQ